MIPLLKMAALIHGLTPSYFAALCYVESTHIPHAINYADGGEDSLGLCQVKLSTARDMGFAGTREQLMQPEINAYYAAKYLKYQIKRYKNTRDGIVAYNAGRKIANTRYYDKVRRAAREFKYLDSKVPSVWAKN